MNALRIKLYQELACYRKPFSFKAGETYPLPPPSTVKGFLHRILGAKEYIPMLLSIQGTYSGITSNLQTTYKFGNKRANREYWAVFGGTAINHNVFYVNLLVDVNLIIHVSAEEGILKSLERSLKSPKEFPSLGRWEDIVRIDEVSLVNLQEIQDEWNGIPIKIPAYVPKNFAIKNNLNGITYQLNDYYEIEQENRRGLIYEYRKWKKIEMVYVVSGRIATKVWIDEYGYPVFWHRNNGDTKNSLC
ncbi:MAG: type I-B CRISPR-associated protein Cas5b [Caldimicrobium sp.]